MTEVSFSLGESLLGRGDISGSLILRKIEYQGYLYIWIQTIY